MNIRLNFKTPDVVWYALQEVPEEYREEVSEVLEEWIEYGENITIEVDTEAKTARVLKRGE